MAFSKAFADAVWKTPLTWQRLTSGLYLNHDHMLNATVVEHDASGNHNTQRIARAVGTINYAGGTTYNVDAGSSGITSVARDATGELTITLSSTWVKETMSVRAAPLGGSGVVPICATGLAQTNTTVRVRVFASTDVTLGTTNTWAATEGSFCLAVHADNTSTPTHGRTALTIPERGSTLGVASGGWNTFVENVAWLYNHMLVGHKETGVHNVRDVARGYARLTWDGTNYAIANSTNVTSISRSSAGVVVFTLPGSTYDDPIQIFPAPDYTRSLTVPGDPTELYVINTPNGSFTTSGGYVTGFTAHIYKYNFTTDRWAKADANFALAIHTAAHF